MAFKFASSRFVQFIRRRAVSIAAASSLLSVLAAAGCGQLAHKERELTFRVEPGTASWYSGLPDGVVESNLVVQSDGKSQNLHTWWWPAEKKDAPAVLYLHGARWNLTGQLFRIQQLHDFGFSVLAVDYRGFGKSDGDLPSERTVYEDAQIAWQHLATLQPDAGKRFIYGHSLGGAVAIDLAAHLAGSADGSTGKAARTEQSMPPAAKGLIVESSFTSLADIARSLTYPWLPLQLLLSQKFDSVGKISRVGMPVLIVHGSSDRYVPSRFSEKLYEAAGGKKKLILVEGGTHNNSMRLGATEYRQAFEELFGLAPDPA
ncbi:alpha/beta fold hydrolase [Noviherbaspirillum sp. CPCC 100848]|uniref:Alpha/beta fold hydrolase n=1 Tax=Noviherbaspirillum album TaxID=3080276 RepID=A0ABU6JBP1_9BURK|nr:alpha/beta fold hydrolase [Noviherbaspirillum sp. CPCC 100848]MEC4720569.1 alpha/beta fold hydrolase [Noviherbaspirillum sp. CPCC 100848]